MRMRRFVLLSLIFLPLLSTSAGNGADGSGTATITPARAGSKAAELTIYRRSKFIGSAIHPTIRVDGQSFVTVHNGHIFHTRIKPGKFALDADGKSPTELEAKAGGKYFLLLTVVPGFINGNGNLTWVTEQQAVADMRELSPVDRDEVENGAFR